MKNTFLAVFLCIIALSVSGLSPAVRADPLRSFAPLSNQVGHSITIRVVLIGINDIDQSQLTWGLESLIYPAIQINHSPTGLQDLTYGSSFTVKYDIQTATPAATAELTAFLQSIATTMKVPEILQGTGYSTSNSDASSYTVIPADQTEDWVNAHISDLGGIPNDGYTLIVTDLSPISSLHHYYQKTYTDLDTASTEASDYKYVWPLTDWMFSWGGRYDFYYLDLSAGDPKFDYSVTGHIPIQDFETRYYSGEKVHFSRTVSTVTEYVSSYIAEAVRNLFLPSYVYAPTYSASYKIEINVFDDTGRVSDANIAEFLSTSRVKNAFTGLIPYASWDVSVTTRELSDDPRLADVVSRSILFSRDVTGSYDNLPVHIDYYDSQPIYAYLQNHLTQYTSSSNGTVILPTFEFIFRGSSRFADTWEESIGGKSSGDFDASRRTFGGVALGDMVIIGLSERSLFAFGYGLAHDTIHENGHQLGLMHPHSYGPTEDYVSSPMSYTTYPYDFSQFDIDAIQRAHADYFFSSVQGVLGASASAGLISMDAKSLMAQANTEYESGVNSYAAKKYADALNDLQKASKLLDQAFASELSAIEKASSDFRDLLAAAAQQKAQGNLGMAYQLLTEASRSTTAQMQTKNSLLLGLSAGLIAGVVIGIAATLFVRRRKPVAMRQRYRVCPTCGLANRLNARYCVRDRTRLI